MMRAEEMQVPAAAKVPVPRVKPAMWSDGGEDWTATTSQGINLTALPSGVERSGDTLRFPKSKFKTMADARAALGKIYPSLADASANADGTYNIYSAVLFSEGTWNDDAYNRGDLEAMVKAHDEVGHVVRPWGKLGHDDAQAYAGSHGMPRIGSLDNLRIQDDVVKGKTVAHLYGDVLNVPAVVYHAMEQKGYTTRSPEIYWNYTAPDGRTFPRVLRAVAFLGAEMPANPTLPELFRAYAEPEGSGDIHVYEQAEPGLSEPAVAEEEAQAPRLYALDLTTKARAGNLVPGVKLRLSHLKGMTRTGIGADGGEWKKKMSADYGELHGVIGADGENMDAYVGPQPNSPHAFMVAQHHPETGDFDEHKLMLGYPDIHAARDSYLDHMPSAAHLGGITQMSVDDVRAMQSPRREIRTVPAAKSYGELKTDLEDIRRRLGAL